MDSQDIQRVQESFALVAPIADQAAELFYQDLFDTAPEVAPYFAHTDMSAQGEKLMRTLSVVVNGLNDLDAIVPVAQALAVRHVDYQVQAADYGKVGASLLRTLEKGLGDAFTLDVKAAWTKAYTTLADVMIDAAYGAKAAQ